jgi:formyl-CoA transferase/CoA:oxalate CoA-transferase
VIKVERVGHGDESRHWGPFFPGEVAHYFAAVNRGKRSLAVDLKQPEGLAIVRTLARDADVLIDNFRVGALDELGLGYDALSTANPRLVYCSISGYGASGPLAKERANDVAMQAFAGGMSITGEPGGAPVKMGISVVDIGAGMFGSIGILMAIEARHRTGRGQKVETSLLEGQIAMLSYHIAAYYATGRAPQPMGSSAQGLVPYQAFKAADRWMVVAVFTDRMWRDLCGVIGRPEWTSDPRFASPSQRKQHRGDIIPELERIFQTQSFEFWYEHLHSVGVPCTPVNTIDQAVATSQVRARDLIVQVEHRDAGPMHLAGLPIKLDETPGSVSKAPPLLGEHTEEILTAAGYSGETVASLVARGVVETATAFDKGVDP